MISLKPHLQLNLQVPFFFLFNEEELVVSPGFFKGYNSPQT